MKVRRMDHSKVQTLSLVSGLQPRAIFGINGRRNPVFKGPFPPSREERYVLACKFPRR
jgi:hypothetical protein